MILSVYTGLFSRCYALASSYKLITDNNGKKLTVIWPVQSEPEALACNIRFYDVFDKSSFPEADISIIDQIVKEEKDLKKMILSFNVRGIIEEIKSRFFASEQNKEIADLKDSSEVIDFHPPRGMLWWDEQYPIYAQEQSDRVIELCKLGKIDNLFIHANASVLKCDETFDFGCIRFNEECVNRAQSIMNHPGKVIGLHLRRTDHGTAITQSPTELFLKKIDEEIANDESVRFFLATDSESEQADLIARYGERIIVQENKAWGRSNIEEMNSGIVDVLCLSMCDKIYGSCGSVFSRFAAEYGSKELIIVKNEE